MIAVYPGSFDPVTYGHIDIIQRACRFFTELHVLVAESSEKKHLFSAEERLQLVQSCLPDLPNVKVVVSKGLTVDYAQSVKAQVIVRGIRAVSDFEYEMAMAGINKKLAPEIETVTIFSNPSYNYISSRFIKEVALHGGPLEDMVPSVVAKSVKQKLNR